MIINVCNLTTKYSNLVIHDDISFSVNKGEVFSILGGSGSGKTTLLHTMIMLHRPSSGKVDILGSDIWNIGQSKRFKLMQRIGVVFQFGALFSSLNVLQNIVLMLDEYSKYPRRLYKDVAMFWINRVGLHDSVCYKKPNELSGGMKKRVALARALITEPDILFLDEPTSGLDPASACKFDDLILDLREAFGVTVVMITHDLDSIRDITDRFILLGDKKVTFCGNLSQFSEEMNRGLHGDSLFNSTRGLKYINMR